MYHRLNPLDSVELCWIFPVALVENIKKISVSEVDLLTVSGVKKLGLLELDSVIKLPKRVYCE
jgi:hypothetical protein